MDNKEDLYVFWRYDLFPYCLWGRAKPTNGGFYISSYRKALSLNSPLIIAVLPESKAKCWIDALKVVKNTTMKPSVL